MSQFMKMHPLFDDVNRLFGLIDTDKESATVETSQWRPHVDIQETPTAFVVHADLPGVEPKAIEVTMHENLLTLRGTRENETVEKSAQYTRTERLAGTFYRQFTLPETADGENIRAKSTHGVLEITIPKIEKAQKRKITIDVSE